MKFSISKTGSIVAFQPYSGPIRKMADNRTAQKIGFVCEAGGLAEAASEIAELVISHTKFSGEKARDILGSSGK